MTKLITSLPQSFVTHYVDDEGILRVTRAGTITPLHERLGVRQRAADPRIVPGMRVLVNCCKVDPSDSSDMVRYLAKRAARVRARTRCGPVAILVSTKAEYGMARMYQQLSDLAEEQCRVFCKEMDALQWLRSR